MLNQNHIRRIEAIRSGFDDRLLTLVEFDPAGPTSLDAAAHAIRAWRRRFEDELEVLAFVRIDPGSTSRRAIDVDAQCSAVRYLSEQQIPVAAALAAPEGIRAEARSDGSGSPRTVERWTPCDSDLRALLMAARMPADMLLNACIESRAPRLGIEGVEGFHGMGCAASPAAQAAFIADFAQQVAVREGAALGPVLTPFGTHIARVASDGDALLSLLSDAVYHRRIRFAA